MSYESPYRAPRSAAQGRVLAIVGMALNLGPLIGKVGAILFMLPAFNALGGGAGSDATELARSMSDHIQRSMLFFIAFLVVGLIGVGIVCFCLLKQRFREPWFFITGVIAAFLWCLTALPVGLVPGILLLVLFLGRKPEFYPGS